MTAVADRNSGEQARIRDRVVDLAQWWLGGWDNPPESIAQLPVEARRERWTQLVELAERRGAEGFFAFISSLAVDVAAQNQPVPTTDVDGPAEAGH